LRKVTIHTDGGCHGNPGPGAWAATLSCPPHYREISGAEPATTNNRMELQAAIAALQALKEPCEVTLFTDSEYLKNGITKWIAGWRRKGWRTKLQTPVKNEDLWRALDAATKSHKIQWQWLKGHAGHDANERCDTLAQEAIAKLKKALGPAELKAALYSFVAR
jgi:ribonuclease HI